MGVFRYKRKSCGIRKSAVEENISCGRKVIAFYRKRISARSYSSAPRRRARSESNFCAVSQSCVSAKRNSPNISLGSGCSHRNCRAVCAKSRCSCNIKPVSGNIIAKGSRGIVSLVSARSNSSCECGVSVRRYVRSFRVA